MLDLVIFMAGVLLIGLLTLGFIGCLILAGALLRATKDVWRNALRGE